MLHTDTRIYRYSLELARLAARVVDQLPRGQAHLADQLRRASASITPNFAEGCGKASPKDRRRYFLAARGSANEVVAVLDVALAWRACRPTPTVSPATSPTILPPCSLIFANRPRRQSLLSDPCGLLLIQMRQPSPQLAIPFRRRRARKRFGWGGRRDGAGRKPGPNPGLRHARRPSFAARHPIHVSLKVRKQLGNLRTERCHEAIRNALAAAARSSRIATLPAPSPPRPRCRVTRVRRGRAQDLAAQQRLAPPRFVDARVRTRRQPRCI